MKSLNILSVGYPFTPVGPNAVGGSEQVLSALDKALTTLGHNSTVIAVRGSEVTGKLVPTPEAKGLLNGDAHAFGQTQHHLTLERILQRMPVEVPVQIGM